jgi:hypothetical protein
MGRSIFLAIALLAGCAQFGVPELPPAYRDPAMVHEAVVVAFDPGTVLGFGHTGLIVRVSPSGYMRYDQYASAELEYGERLQAGSARFWEGLTARLPSVFGLTRETVVRREGPAVAALLLPQELAVPLPGVDPQAVRAAAESRWRNADGLERESAPRYVWLFNNCHHFVRDVLHDVLLPGGGPAVPDDYFPKHWVEAAIRRLPP